MTLTPSRVNQGAAGTAAWPVAIGSISATVTEKQDQPASTTATWTSATVANTAVTVNTTAYGTANVSIQVPSTVTAGVITLEVSDDNTIWYPAGAVRVDNSLAENVINLPGIPAGAAINRMWAISTDAMTQVRARLSTVITGTGNVVVRVGTVAGGIEPMVATIPPRTMFAATASGITAVTSEALMSLTPVRGITAAGAATAQVVTTGKTMRIMSITVGLLSSAGAIVQGYLVLRARSAATLAITDPALWRIRMSNQAAVSGQAQTQTVTFPDGIDLPSGANWGVSHIASAVTATWELSINGYEL